MVYGRPPSSGSPFYLQSKSSLPTQPIVTPMASPRPLQQKPAFLYQHDGLPLSVDTECGTPDVYVYPSTPPLSVSGSTISSPPSTCGILPTPTTGTFFTLENIEGVKEGCEGDVQSEILAGGDWTRSCSPPLTPGKSKQVPFGFSNSFVEHESSLCGETVTCCGGKRLINEMNCH